VIGNYVWVCFRSIILPGVSVGQGSVVASGSVVAKDVPPFSVVAGAPARVIGTRNRALSYRLGNPNSQAFE
jgi:acetyltransferase-like isoleucine patch superfamily enzyme